MRYPSVSREQVSSLRNALRLLGLFHMDRPELNVSEMAEELRVGVSTAYRLANTLLEEGFLVKDPHTRMYRLAASLMGMGQIIIARTELCRLSSEALMKLVERSGETTHLAIVQDNQVFYLNKIDGEHPVYLMSHAGRKLPVHCTSTGQAIIAFRPEEEIERLIAMGLPAYTRNTITDRERFRAKLEQIRKEGYALSVEELHEGVTSIAAPVRLPSGESVASVSIAGPSRRINRMSIPRLARLVMEAAAEVSAKLADKRDGKRTGK
jgi:DNA-binding IclR family transcriptional regulator